MVSSGSTATVERRRDEDRSGRRAAPNPFGGSGVCSVEEAAMTPTLTTATVTRSFEVHVCDEDRCHARRVQATSFEVAAVAYLEICGPSGAGKEARLMVRDAETGHEHCIAIDLDTGEAAPCG
jgi:hypothetical protein